MSNSLYTMSFAAHVADFHRALEDTPNEWPRKALTLLKGDPIAQIMSFMPSREERRGLSAASPQMRLDSEVMADEGHIWRVEPRARMGVFSFHSTCALNNRELLFRFDTDSKETRRQQMMLSLWWASRCGLPVELLIDNNDSDMLMHFDETLRSGVKRLIVNTRSSPVSVSDDAVDSNSTSTTTILMSVLSFSNMQSLSILNDEQQADTPLSAEVLNALETTASLPVAALSVDGCGSLQDLRTLAGSRSLQSLTVRYSGLLSLEGLGSCSTLETLRIANCPQLTGLTNLIGLSHLQSAHICDCDLRSLDGIDRCVALKSVNVHGNPNLQSLSPLAGAPLLQIIDASHCGIGSVQGLGSCAALTQIFLGGNRNLQSLGDLSKAPCLQKVNATNCDLRDLGEAGPWSALREIRLAVNRNLQSLSPLAGAPLLQNIDASYCDIRSVQGLDLCAALTMIFLNSNRNLQSLGDLSKAPCLQKVEARYCGLRHIGEAGRWSALREIYVVGNHDLQSLSVLAGAPLLEEVHAVRCDIQDVTVLKTCPKLFTVLTNISDDDEYFDDDEYDGY